MATTSTNNSNSNEVQLKLPGNLDGGEKDGQVSDARAVGKSLLEDHGFKIIKKIGSGTYSKVKLAYSESHQKTVAIKIVSKYHVPEEFLRNFLYNEINVVKFLSHENIIKYYTSLESSHRLYVVMQVAENGSILDLIHKERRLSESRACKLFRQIIAGIEHCHQRGIAHRDLKCENILLDENFVVKLIDFGFARSFRAAQKTSTLDAKAESTDVGLGKAMSSSAASQKSSSSRKIKNDPRISETYCGSYAYASPEILKGVPYDPFMSDIWAMGCVLFAMVFGRLPFDDRDPSKLIKQVQAPIVFPPTIEASDDLKNCLRKILAPLKSRYDIEALKNDFWINSADLEHSTKSAPSRKLSTR